jgi:SAM-dependent methyltransferase
MANDYKTVWDNAAKGDWRNAILTGSNADTFETAGEADANFIFKTFSNSMETEPRSVMDFGCGAGRILKPMLDKVDKGYGVDVSPGMLQLCTERCGVGPIRLDTRVYGRDGLDDVRVDLAYSWLCLQHMEYAHAFHAITVMHNCLEPGGMFIATFPNGHSDAYWDCITAFEERPYPLPTAHVRIYVPDMVRLFLNRAGFEAVDVRGEEPIGRSSVSKAEILAIGRKPK